MGLVIAGVAVWNLKPEAPAPVSRFSYVLPEGQESTTTNIPLLALSPDGSRMVYAVNNQQLYMREMDSLESSPIPGTDENPAMPFFSPDGQSIAYWSGGQLKKIDVNGGIPVSLAEAAAPRGAIWGTDGNIVFHQPEGIMQVSANAGTPELLVAVSEDRRSQGIFFPQVLPDGESVLSQLGSDPEGQIVVQSLESGERKVLFPGTHPRYVPSGHIVYGLDEVLYAVPFDLGRLEAVGGAVPMVERVSGATIQYAVADSGPLVYMLGGAVLDSRILALGACRE